MYRWLIIICLATVTPGHGSERELKWDNGDCLMLEYWPKGAGKWWGNDFDISTLKTFSRIKGIKLVSAMDWPNHAWDGFRLGVFDFSANIPGRLLWPESGTPKFVIGTGGPGPVWCEFAVSWNLPSGHRKFVAAMEQFYDVPNCDIMGYDSYQGVPEHSWYKLSIWYRVRFYNLMIRVFVEEVDAVAPASLGRVKALYR